MRQEFYTQPAQEVKFEGHLDFFQLLSGVALILFMWSHMILVASINFGPGVMNAIATFLERTYMAQLGGPAIAVLFLIHFVLTARKIPFRAREQRIIWAHSARLAHRDTWLWVIQAVTAMLILILGCIHMWTVLTDLPISAAKSAARVQRGWWLFFYAFLLPLVELHVGIGFYRIGVKWGWINRANRGFFKGFESKLTVFFITVGAITLFTFYFLISAGRGA